MYLLAQLQGLPEYQLEEAQQSASLERGVDPREADLQGADRQVVDLQEALRQAVPQQEAHQRVVRRRAVLPQGVALPQSALHRLSPKGIRLVRKLQPARTRSP